MDTNLSGKTILITGASKGIGKAIALHLSQFGAKLALVARNQGQLDSLKREVESRGGTARSYQADVTDFHRAIEVINLCESQLGPIDALINNAGVLGPNGSVLEHDLEELWQTIETNVRGPMAYMQAALPLMLQRNRGMVLNMGSYTSVHPFPANATYSASKAALARYTDSVAASLEQSQVELFTLSPGLVRTDMTQDAPFVQSIPEESWSPIEAICDLVGKLLGGGYSALKGRFIHVRDDLEQLLGEAERINSDNLYSLTLNNLKTPAP